MKDLKFEYNLFIGEHMSEPLRVKKSDRVRELIGIIGNKLYFHAVGGGKCTSMAEDNIPQIRTPKSLSDEEWLFVFGFDTGVYKISTCYHDDDEINEKYVVKKDATGWGDRTIISFVFPYDDITGGFLGKLEKFPVTQQILNRMYSLQTCTNAEELIAADLAEEIVC